MTPNSGAGQVGAGLNKGTVASASTSVLEKAGEAAYLNNKQCVKNCRVI